MSTFANRDIIAKRVAARWIMNGLYRVQDFVTTYHPTGELPPQYRYVRNLVIDWNVRFSYLLEQIYVVDHALANDNDSVSAAKGGEA